MWLKIIAPYYHSYAGLDLPSSLHNGGLSNPAGLWFNFCFSKKLNKYLINFISLNLKNYPRNRKCSRKSLGSFACMTHNKTIAWVTLIDVSFEVACNIPSLHKERNRNLCYGVCIISVISPTTSYLCKITMTNITDKSSWKQSWRFRE